MNLNQHWPKVPWVGLLSHQIWFFYFSVSQGICCMRFSDAPFVHICFLFLLFGFLCFPIFSSLVCFDFSLMLTSFCFWKYTYLHYWAIQIKKIENSFAKITAKKIVWTSMVYFWNLYLCWKKVCCLKEVDWFRSLSKYCHDHLLYFYAIPIP